MGHLDGNTLAGPLAELFAFDPTTASGKCDGCEDVSVLAQSLLYGRPMGHVARCRNCDNVLLVIVEHGGRTLLDMRGLRWVQPGEAPGTSAPAPQTESDPTHVSS